MRYNAFVLTLLVSLATLLSCNRNDDPPAEVNIVILETFVPKEVVFDKGDEEMLTQCKDLSRKLFVVKSADEFPEDPIGFSTIYTTTDFPENMLLITYILHPVSYFGSYESFWSRYVRNNLEKSYDWYLMVRMTYHEDESSPLMRLTRFAIKVPKIPEGFTPVLQFSESVSDVGWDD